MHPLIVHFGWTAETLGVRWSLLALVTGEHEGRPTAAKSHRQAHPAATVGQSGTKQLDKKGGETEIESSPSPLSHAAPHSATRPSPANLPTQHGQPLQRPHSAPVSTLKRVACPSSKGPRPQSAPDSNRPAHPKQSHHHGESAATGPLSNGTHSAQAKMLPQPSGPGRPPIPTAPVQPADGHHKASRPEARQQLMDRAAPAAETVKAHTVGSKKTLLAFQMANNLQKAEELLRVFSTEGVGMDSNPRLAAFHIAKTQSIPRQLQLEGAVMRLCQLIALII